MSEAYRAAGVDLDRAATAKRRMVQAVRSTYGPDVVAGIGAFAGMVDLSRISGMRNPLLVASTDGVGTKTKLAEALGRYDTLGYDIVNHCIDDILVSGARPLYLLDYMAFGTLDAEVATQIVESVAAACREAGIALLGGETATMPDVYREDAFDLAGTIIGVVERDEVINGCGIKPGDAILGLPSSGLHTNGYSLARRLFPPERLGEPLPGTDRMIGEALLEPHRSYLDAVTRLSAAVPVQGLVHITGGGYQENIPRILPDGVAARIDTSSWEPLPIFQLIARESELSRDELFRVFNMGVGMLAFVRHDDVATALTAVPEAQVIGTAVERQSDAVVIV